MNEWQKDKQVHGKTSHHKMPDPDLPDLDPQHWLHVYVIDVWSSLFTLWMPNTWEMELELELKMEQPIGRVHLLYFKQMNGNHGAVPYGKARVRAAIFFSSKSMVALDCNLKHLSFRIWINSFVNYLNVIKCLKQIK